MSSGSDLALLLRGSPSCVGTAKMKKKTTPFKIMCCIVLSHSVVSTFCNLMDCSLPGSSVHGDSPGENIGGWVAMPSSRESSTLFYGSIFPSLASFFSFGICNIGFPGGSVVKSWPANAGDGGLIPRSGRSPGEGNGNPLQYSCLKNPIDRGVWQATVH